MWLLFGALCFYITDVDLKLLYRNTCGLNDKVKRSLLFKYLHYHKPHVLFLKETHLMGINISALRKAWVKQGFHATYSTYARGVAIILNHSLSYLVEQVITDPGGRYIILILQMYDSITLYTVYTKLSRSRIWTWKGEWGLQCYPGQYLRYIQPTQECFS